MSPTEQRRSLLALAIFGTALHLVAFVTLIVNYGWAALGWAAAMAFGAGLVQGTRQELRRK